MINKLNQDGLLQIEVNPFTRLVWNSTEAREKYEVMLNRALPLHDKAEYEMVRRGLRKCGTILSPTPHSLGRFQRTTWFGCRFNGQEVWWF